MRTYGCMATDIPLAPADECAPFISKASGGECLAASCACGCQRFFNTSEANPAPSPEETSLCETLKCAHPPVDMASACAPGCGAGMVCPPLPLPPFPPPPLPPSLSPSLSLSL